MQHLKVKKLKLVIRHYETIQVVDFIVVFVNACVTVHNGLCLDETGCDARFYGSALRRLELAGFRSRRR